MLSSSSSSLLRPALVRRALAKSEPHRLRSGPISPFLTTRDRAPNRNTTTAPGFTRFVTTSTSASLERATSVDPAPTVSPAPIPRSRLRRFLTTTSLFLVFLTAGFSMAAAPAAETINGFVNPPTDAESLGLFEPETAFAAEVNDYIINHPLAKKLRAQPGVSESRAHMKIPPPVRAHNLTAGVLMGEDKLEVPPLAFNERDAALPTMVQLSYLGPALCGHPGIIHGGMLATMLDEGLARACFPALPHKVGVTASLKIDYRIPCPAKSYVVMKAQTTKVEGRKAWVKGTIEILGDEESTGKVLVEAEALFIEPKNVAALPKVYSTQ